MGLASVVVRGLPMTFDPTISAGTILNLLALLVTVAIVWSKLAARLGAMEAKVDAIWKWFTERRGFFHGGDE